MMDLVKAYAPFALAGLQLLFLWVGWSIRHGMPSKKEFDSVEKRVSLAEQQIDVLNDLRSLQQHFYDLHGEHKALQARWDGMQTSIERIQITLSRVENYLLGTKA